MITPGAPRAASVGTVSTQSVSTHALGAHWRIVMTFDAKTCRACSHCYMEPDSGFVCGLPKLGLFGRTIRVEGEHCGGFKSFEQHPPRNVDGSLKKRKKK